MYHCMNCKQNCKLQLLKMHTNITSFIECILQGEIQLVQCHVLIVSFLIQAFLFDFSWEEYRSQHYKLKWYFALTILKLKWGVYFRWSLRPNSAWWSIETTIIGKTHPTLLLVTNLRPWNWWWSISQLVFRPDRIFCRSWSGIRFIDPCLIRS